MWKIGPVLGVSTEALGFSALDALEVDLLTVGNDEVQHGHGSLVDVVFHALGLAVQEGEAHERGDRGDETEGGAVHRLGDTFSEDACLLARIDGLTTDGAERLDKTDDGPEQAAEHREVGEE